MRRSRERTTKAPTRSSEPVETESRATRRSTESPRGEAAHRFSGIDVVPAAGLGPFAPELNALFSAAFGEPLADVDVVRGADDWNAALGAPASTVGSRIFLSSSVTEDLDDSHSMDVLAHELAHALGTPGRVTDLVDRPGIDLGEAAARDAGSAMGRFAAQGARGAVPALGAADGGAAAVHRWGSGEHKDAVDMALGNLNPSRVPGGEVNPEVARLMNPEQRIRLANGVEVSPGEITALMGDFYGSFDQGEDGKEHFNPQRSFEQLWNAPAEEMSQLVDLVRRDAASARGDAGAQAVDEAEWEAATAGRGPDQRTYLELAEVNDSHFSGRTMEGVDNNMGVYSIFHQMALEAAAEGTPEALNRARALEASSGHYLTDRHASGHSFEKAGVQDAGGWTDTGGNLAAKIVHDRYNEQGIDATNAMGGPSWLALGDEHWNDDRNAENRARTAESVYTSWSELEEAARGGRSAEEIQQAGYGAYDTVPQFSEERQRAAERDASDSVGMLDKGGLILDELSLAGPMAERWFSKNIAHPAGELADWADREVLTPVGDFATGVGRWTDREILTPVGDAVGGAIDTVTEGATDLWKSIWD